MQYIKPKTFVNSEGENLTYTNWAQDQPDNYNGEEKYVTMSLSDGKWSDFTGHYTAYVFCVQDCSVWATPKPTTPANYAASCADLTKSGLIAGSNLAKFGTLTVSCNSNDLSSHGDPMQKAQIMDDDCSTHWHSFYYADSWVNYKFNKEQKVAKVAIKVRQREFFFLRSIF